MFSYIIKNAEGDYYRAKGGTAWKVVVERSKIHFIRLLKN